MQRILALFITLALATASLAAVPQTLSYQGSLSDANGNPLGGSHSIAFALYDAEVDGNQLWSETQNLDIVQGAFSAVLGCLNPLGLTFDQQYWLGVQVGSDPELPRTQLTSSPYSLNAASAEKLGDSVLLDGSGRMRIVTAGNGAALQAETPGSGSIYLRGNTQGQSPHHDALLKLEASSDYRGRGMLLTHRNTDDQTNNAWFVGVPYQGGQFQIGNSSSHAENTNGGAYTREAAKLTIAENGEVGVANALTVGGTTQTMSFKMPTNAVSGHVLTVDADGVGTWQAPGAVGSGQIADGSVTGDKLASDLIYNSSVTISASVANGHALTVINEVSGSDQKESAILIRLGENTTNGDNSFLTFQNGNNKEVGSVSGFSLAHGDFLPPDGILELDLPNGAVSINETKLEQFISDLGAIIGPLPKIKVTMDNPNIGTIDTNIPSIPGVPGGDPFKDIFSIFDFLIKQKDWLINLAGNGSTDGVLEQWGSEYEDNMSAVNNLVNYVKNINSKIHVDVDLPDYDLAALAPKRRDDPSASLFNNHIAPLMFYLHDMGFTAAEISDLYDAEEVYKSMALLALDISFELAAMDGGVTYESGAADFAEWLPRLDENEKLRFGQIVGVRGGKITKDTKDADDYMVVSMAPAVLGNVPEKGKEALYEKIAFIGQVPVWVKGAVNEGDYIIASGKSDGTGIAVSPDSMRAADFARVVGRAWQASAHTGLKLINTAIGMESDGWVAFAAKHQQQMQAIAQENDSMQNELTALARQNASLLAELQTLQVQVTQLETMEARLARFESTLSRLEAFGWVPNGTSQTEVAERP